MSQTAPEKIRWITADLEVLAADEWKRYEIIDGELFVTRAPLETPIGNSQYLQPVRQLVE